MFKPNRYMYEVVQDFVDELKILRSTFEYQYKKGDIVSLRKDSEIEKRWSDANLIKIIEDIEPIY